MRRVVVLAVTGLAVGCGEPNPTKPDDPNIKAERTIIHPGGGASVGPVGGGYHHGAKTERYEGPASKAPAWAK
jgi:hypothetical protein